MYAIRGMIYAIETHPKPPTMPRTVEIPGSKIASIQVDELKRIELTKALTKNSIQPLTVGKCSLDL
jgi:hypothetical protein